MSSFLPQENLIVQNWRKSCHFKKASSILRPQWILAAAHSPRQVPEKHLVWTLQRDTTPPSLHTAPAFPCVIKSAPPDCTAPIVCFSESTSCLQSQRWILILGICFWRMTENFEGMKRGRETKHFSLANQILANCSNFCELRIFFLALRNNSESV